MFAPLLRCLRRNTVRKSNFLKIEEELSWGYEPGRYCRIRIGDTLSKRYQIVGKVGWGQFSTVWVAQDTQNAQYVSVKVATRSLLRDPKHERDVLKYLNDGDTVHPGYNHVIHLLDFFVHEGPTGQHVCLVYKTMGESMDRIQSRFPDQKLPLPLMKRVSRQLLQAVDYVHGCGLIHTDISSGNILCDLDGVVMKEFLEDVPKAQKAFEMPTDRPIPSTPMRAPEDIQHLNIRLADFGQSVYSSQLNEDCQAQPQAMRAPEVILGLSWDSKIDIWNVACYLWEAFERRFLFDVREAATDKYSARRHLQEIVHNFGAAPPELVSRQTIKYLNGDGTTFELEPLTYPTWEHTEENLKGDEQLVFLDFIGSMLQWLPEKRPSAKEALEHRWLKV